jgi:ankyrin repeat protein
MIHENDVKGIEDAIQNGLDVDSVILPLGGQFLHYAAMVGRPEIIKFLIAAGANIEGRSELGNPLNSVIFRLE